MSKIVKVVLKLIGAPSHHSLEKPGACTPLDVHIDIIQNKNSSPSCDTRFVFLITLIINPSLLNKELTFHKIFSVIFKVVIHTIYFYVKIQVLYI